MIDTLLLNKQLTSKEEYSSIDNLLSSNDNLYNKIICKTTRIFIKQFNFKSRGGVNFQLHHNKSDDNYDFFNLKVFCKPSEFLGKNYFEIELSDISDVQDAMYEIDELLNATLGYYNFSYKDFNLSRLDVTKDIYFKKEEGYLVDCYIGLLQKARVPAKFKKNRISYDDSINFRNKSVGVNIYNKNAELKANSHIDFDEINILRVEFQLLTRKVSAIKSHEKFENRGIDNYLYNQDLLNDLAGKYLELMYLQSDYFTLDIARDIIRDDTCRENTKKSLINLLEYISIHHGIDANLFKKYENYTYLFQKLNKLNVNPVTIPRNFRIDNLPSIKSLIGDFF